MRPIWEMAGEKGRGNREHCGEMLTARCQEARSLGRTKAVRVAPPGSMAVTSKRARAAVGNFSLMRASACGSEFRAGEQRGALLEAGIVADQDDGGGRVRHGAQKRQDVVRRGHVDRRLEARLDGGGEFGGDQPPGFAGARGRGDEGEVGLPAALRHQAADPRRRLQPALRQRPVEIVESGIVPGRLGVAEETEGFHAASMGAGACEGKGKLCRASARNRRLRDGRHARFLEEFCAEPAARVFACRPLSRTIRCCSPTGSSI